MDGLVPECVSARDRYNVRLSNAGGLEEDEGRGGEAMPLLDGVLEMGVEAEGVKEVDARASDGDDPLSSSAAPKSLRHASMPPTSIMGGRLRVFGPVYVV